MFILEPLTPTARGSGGSFMLNTMLRSVIYVVAYISVLMRLIAFGMALSWP